MISQIGLTNFKCFQGEHNFPLSRFNLLTGINGRGKSTLLQSLLLMKQTTDYDIKSNYIILNGSCVQLGSFEDIKNSFASNEDEIKFVFKSLIENNEELKSSLSEVISRYELGLSRREDLELDSDSLEDIEYLKNIYNNAPKSFIHEVHYTFKQDDNDDSIAIINEFSDKGIFDKNFKTRVLTKYEDQNHFYYKDLDAKSTDFNDVDEFKDTWFFENLLPINEGYNGNFFKYIQFISADRLGPKNFYERQNVNQGFSWIGARGENVASILFLLRDDNIHASLYLGEDANTLLQQTEEWLNFIFDGAKININTEGGVVLISYNTKQGRERYKPSNVGFGYSYILPIVVAGLIAEPNEILIIENPEAHLHPKAQHKLTQFLAKVAATGVQIFVESHSEHILNALRICTLSQEGQEKILNNTDLSILYFQDNPTTPFVQIPIDEKGGIEEWPVGFFDQTDKDFKILFGF